MTLQYIFYLNDTFYYHFRIILYKSTPWSGWRLKDKYMDPACRSHFKYQLQSFAVVAAVMKNHCGTYLKWLPTHSEKNVSFFSEGFTFFYKWSKTMKSKQLLRTIEIWMGNASGQYSNKLTLETGFLYSTKRKEKLLKY